jgi:Flp pilus assembly protein TadD
VAAKKDPDAWVLLGIILGSQDRADGAEAAYLEAIALDPEHSIAHHNLGALLSRVGKPEAALFRLERAKQLGENGFELAFNLGRAHLELRDVDAAETAFAQAAHLQPSNPETQLYLARLRHAKGQPQFARSLAAACAADRSNTHLQYLFGSILWRAGDLNAAESVLRDLLKRSETHADAHCALAGVLLDREMLIEAEDHALTAAALAPDDETVIEMLVTILLSRGRIADAVPFIKDQRKKKPHRQSWIAYETTAARFLDKALYERLCDYERFVRIFELEAPSGWSSMKEFNQALSKALTDSHCSKIRPLDQTVRHGTQTMHSLLTDSNSIIQSALMAFRQSISQYCQSLPVTPNHPLLGRLSQNVAYTGAWSVRLGTQGFHVNHFHPEGWLSSAYYVDVPTETQNQDLRSGWIKFGEPRYPVPGATPERFIQPKAARLVLFPSYMWHGTTPIRGDEPRMSIAFDVQPQDG